MRDEASNPWQRITAADAFPFRPPAPRAGSGPAAGPPPAVPDTPFAQTAPTSAPADGDHDADSGELADLFGDDAADAAADDSLDALFAGPAPADDDHPGDVEPASTTRRDGAGHDGAGHDGAGRDGAEPSGPGEAGPSNQFAATMVAEDPPAAAADGDAAEVGPRAARPQEPAPAAPTTAARNPSRGLGLAERRRAAQAASAAVAADTDVAADAERARMELRYAAQERLYGYVDRILGFVSQDPVLQEACRHFVLTRDAGLDAAQRRHMQELIAPRLFDAHINIGNPSEVSAVFDIAYDEYIGISVLGDLWRDDDVTEILVDSWDRVAVERNGRLEKTGVRFRSPEHANSIARHLSQKISDRGLSPTSPLVTAQLPQARVQFVWGTLTSSGTAIALRKFRPLMGMDALLRVGALTADMRDFLADAVRARATILVSGGTGTGKTTMINALSEFIPDHERVLTIEDALELQLSNTHVVSLQAKAKASADDSVVVSQEDLLVASLRMRPDRIIVGEIREPAAAATMLQAANTGHDGTMTTIHANSPVAALNSRLTSLLVRSGAGFGDDVARLEVATAINLVIQITRRHGRRYVSDIGVVDPSCIRGGLIVPEPVFAGDVAGTGDTTQVTHRRVGGVRPDTELGIKLADAGCDLARWESP